MVADGIKKSDPKSGVFNFQGFSTFLPVLKPRVGNKIITRRAEVSTKKRKNEVKQRKLIFVAMPFDQKYEDAYFFAMNEAGKS